MPTPEKVQQVELIKEKVTRAKSLFLTDYSGLKVLDMTHLRRELQKSKAEFKVAKNTLIQRALEGTAYSSLSQHLTGQIGIGFGYDDPTWPAKVLHDFFKRIEKPKVKVFYLEGRSYPGNQLSQIASLPSKDVLLTQVLGGIQSPLVNLVGTLKGMLSNLVLTLEALREQKEKLTQVS